MLSGAREQATVLHSSGGCGHSSDYTRAKSSDRWQLGFRKYGPPGRRPLRALTISVGANL